MKFTKEEFERYRPLHHVMVAVECLYRNQWGRIILPNSNEAKYEFATHKGIVHMHPERRAANPAGCMFTTEYEIEIGDTVYFAWDAVRIVTSQTSDPALHIEVEGRDYILIAYHELMLAERGEEKWGLNGWVGGFHPKKLRPPSKIQLLGQNWEQEFIKVLTGDIRELDTNEYDVERIEVHYAPKTYPVYDLPDNSVVHQTRVNFGDVVCFHEGFACALSSFHNDGYLLKAVNVKEIRAYATRS